MPLHDANPDLSTRKALIVANGRISLAPGECRRLAGPDVRVIAADGGLHHCRQFGFRPHVIIGDMDSVSPEILEETRPFAEAVYIHPERKDHTDLELALQHAVEWGATEMIILGALGGRWDMSLANIGLLASSFLGGRSVRILDRDLEIRLLTGKGRAAFSGSPGDILTLIPFGSAVHGISLQGLEYPLENAAIESGSTRGVSNVFQHHTVTVSILDGCLLAIHSRSVV